MSDEPALTLTMQRKINLGQYEMAEVFIAVSGVTAGMTEEDLAPLMNTGKLAWTMVAEEMRGQLAVARRTKGWEAKDHAEEESRAEYERTQQRGALDRSSYDDV